MQGIQTCMEALKCQNGCLNVLDKGQEKSNSGAKVRKGS